MWVVCIIALFILGIPSIYWWKQETEYQQLCNKEDILKERDTELYEKALELERELCSLGTEKEEAKLRILRKLIAIEKERNEQCL